MTGPPASAARCSYCGLPMAAIAPVVDQGPQFCCLGCQWADAVRRESASSAGMQRTLARLGLAIFCTLFVVVFTMALWTPDIYGPQATSAQGESAHRLAQSVEALFRHLNLLGSLPVVWLLGGPLALRAWQNLRRGRLTADVLLASGVAAAWGYSVVSVLRGTGHVYFEVACVVLVFVTLGRWLEATGRLKTTAALDGLDHLLPSELTVRRPAGREVIAAAALESGDLVEVGPGARIPVDGVVVEGIAAVDEQLLTGESRPVEKQPGQAVLGGSLNLDGALLIEAAAGVGQGTLARLLEVVRQARQSKGRYERLADRIAAVFIPTVSVVALAAAAWHGWQLGLDRGLLVGLSVVLIACPCALALATPMAVWAAMGQAASRQILFRHGEALERLAQVRALRLDKTGTLTTGRPAVAQALWAAGTSAGAVVEQVRALCGGSQHAFAQALSTWSREQPGSAAEPPAQTWSSLRTVPGRGIAAETILAGRSQPAQVYLGSAAWMRQLGQPLGELTEPVEAALTEGHSLSCLAWGGQVQAAFIFREELRSDADQLVAWCRQQGLDLAILTGDHQQRAAALSRQLGGDPPPRFEAELLPEAKLLAIRRAHNQFGAVAMVGDGLNDAPALAAADVGIALGCGADVSRESAQVCLLASELIRVAEAIELSRQTVRVIRQNLAWSFGYNSIGVALAAAGWLNPAIAAGLMVGSSLVVITNSLRLRGLAMANSPSRASGRETAAVPTAADLDAVPPAPRAEDLAVQVDQAKPWHARGSQVAATVAVGSVQSAVLASSGE